MPFKVYCEGNFEAKFDTKEEAGRYITNNTESHREPLFNWSIKEGELTPEEFLYDLFYFEDCHNCGRGADNHEAILVLGNFFARCKTCM